MQPGRVVLAAARRSDAHRSSTKSSSCGWATSQVQTVPTGGMRAVRHRQHLQLEQKLLVAGLATAATAAAEGPRTRCKVASVAGPAVASRVQRPKVGWLVCRILCAFCEHLVVCLTASARRPTCRATFWRQLHIARPEFHAAQTVVCFCLSWWCLCC